MSVASEIERLVGVKQDIKNAIVAKGQSVSDTDAFGTYADKILAITSEITAADDGAGNVTITLESATVTDDGEGNVTVA